MIYGYPFGELLGKNRFELNRSSVSSLRKEGGKLRLIQHGGRAKPRQLRRAGHQREGRSDRRERGEVAGARRRLASRFPPEEADLFVKDQHRVGGGSKRATSLSSARTRFARRSSPQKSRRAIHLQTLRLLPAVAGTEVKLPAECAEVCVGGNGRYLIATLPKVKQIAVFDTTQSKVVEHCRWPPKRALVAAGADKLVVGYPDTNIVQQLEPGYLREGTDRHVPRRGDFGDPAWDRTSRGPLYVGATTSDRGSTARFLDLASLERSISSSRRGKCPASESTSVPPPTGRGVRDA